MRRNVLLSTLSAVLLSARRCARRHGHGPQIRRRPMWPKPLPTTGYGRHRGRVGGRQSQHLDIHRPNALEDTEVHAAKTRPGRSAARPLRRFSNSIKPATSSATGEAPAPATIGRSATRNHRRLQGQCLDWRRRPAHSPHDDMLLKFTHEGKIPHADRQAPSEQGQRRHENLRLPAKTFIDPKPMKSTSRRLRQPSR